MQLKKLCDDLTGAAHSGALLSLVLGTQVSHGGKSGWQRLQDR